MWLLGHGCSDLLVVGIRYSHTIAALRAFSLNCHGVNDGIIKYLEDASNMFDIILLQETWLSNKTSVQLEKISSGLSVVHCSAMEIKLQSDYMRSRPFGDTAVLYKNNMACFCTPVT